MIVIISILRNRLSNKFNQKDLKLMIQNYA